MLKIKDLSKVPNGLYTYTPEGMGRPLSAHSFGLLVVKVRNYLVANQKPVPENLAFLVEQDWCSRRPDHCYDPEDFVQAEESHGGDLLSEIIAAAAIPAADALATISKALGINCATCVRRHRIIKEMKKRGFAETVQLLKETLAR